MWPETVRKSDLRIEYYRGSGAGGQKKNKTSSACRLTHLPTGHVASSESGRSQTANRHDAFRKLSAVLVPLMQKAARTSAAVERCKERVRTYHEPRGTVTDHRTGRTAPYSKVLDGDIEVLR